MWFWEMSVGETSIRANFIWGTVRQGNARSGKCPSRKYPSGNCPSRKCPSGKSPSVTCPLGNCPRTVKKCWHCKNHFEFWKTLKISPNSGHQIQVKNLSHQISWNLDELLKSYKTKYTREAVSLPGLIRVKVSYIVIVALKKLSII